MKIHPTRLLCRGGDLHFRPSVGVEPAHLYRGGATPLCKAGLGRRGGGGVVLGMDLHQPFKNKIINKKEKKLGIIAHVA
jgi:hypothetical protein